MFFEKRVGNQWGSSDENPSDDNKSENGIKGQGRVVLN